MEIIEVTISGGAVQYVEFPRGVKVVIRDYDVEGGDLDGPDICQDDQGDHYQKMEFVHEEDRALEDRIPRALIPSPVRVFKLWVSIEAIDEHRNVYADLADLGFIEPLSLGAFPRLSQAIERMLSLPGCVKDERDKAMLTRAMAIERQVWKRIKTSSSPKRTDRPAKVLADLSRVDWKLLRRQKESLLRAIGIIAAKGSKKRQEDLNGILHLLDSIQDQAADRLGESTVFGQHDGRKAAD